MIDVYTSDVVIPNHTYPFGVVAMPECNIKPIIKEEDPNRDYPL
jgi:hypothetical protein